MTQAAFPLVLLYYCIYSTASLITFRFTVDRIGSIWWSNSLSIWNRAASSVCSWNRKKEATEEGRFVGAAGLVEAAVDARGGGDKVLPCVPADLPEGVRSGVFLNGNQIKSNQIKSNQVYLVTHIINSMYI